MKKENWFISFTVVFFILELFRVPLLAFLNLREYGFVLHIAALGLPLLLCQRVSWTLPRSRYFLFFGVWSVISSAILFSKGMTAGVYVTTLGSLFIPFLYPVLMDFFSNRAEDWQKILEKTFHAVFYLGCTYIFMEWFLVKPLHLLDQCQISSFIAGQRNDQFCNTGRYMPVGFFIYKDMSLAIVMGTFLTLSQWQRRWESILRWCLLGFCFFVVDSITLTLIFALLLPIRFWSHFQKDLAWKIFFFLCAVLLLTYSSLYERVLSYIAHEMDLNRFAPSLKGCTTENLGFSLSGNSEHCHSREAHSLFYLFKFGFLATLSWYATLAYIGIFFLKSLIKDKSIPLLLFFPMVFLLNAIHYSGAESWGINYLIFIILFLCMSDRTGVLKRTSIDLHLRRR